MSALGRSVFALVARRAASRPIPTAGTPQLASSFASSSRVRLDSPSPSSSSSAPASPAATDAAAPPIAPLITSRSSAASKSKYRIPPASVSNDASHTLTISASRNNTVLTFADRTGPIFPTISAGTDKGFKNSQRASYEAAHQAALKMFGRIQEYAQTTGRTESSGLVSHTTGIGNRRLKVVFKGLRGGQGREAVASAIAGQEGDGIKPFIGRVEDRTGIKIGGTKGKRVRRL